MEFYLANNVTKLCAEGMEMEGNGKPEEVSKPESRPYLVVASALT